MVIQLFIGTSTRQWAEEEGEYELMSTQLWSCGTIPTSLTCTTRAIFSSCCKVELLLAGNSSYAIQVYNSHKGNKNCKENTPSLYRVSKKCV